MSPGTSQRRRPLQVLVVENNPDAGDSLALLLRLYGHEAAVARDGDAAEAACRAFPPAALLLDLALPRQDGFGVARLLLPLLERRPLLAAVTCHGREEVVRRCQREGFDHHFLKPADPAVLRRVLEDHAARLAREEGPGDCRDPGASGPPLPAIATPACP